MFTVYAIDMTRGRKPTPNALKVLRGTDQPVRMRNEVNAERVTSIDAKGMKVLKTKRARDIFTTKGNQLIVLGTLTDMDLESLAVYANSLDMLFDCMDHIAKEDKFTLVQNEKQSYYVANPYLKLYKEMVEIVNKVGSDFGFSPVSRAKIAAPPREDDQLANLMRQFE